MFVRQLTVLTLIAAALLCAAPAFAADVYINGSKATGLRNADMVNCSVKFDADGNIHIISPGYNVTLEKDDTPRLTGSSDLAAAREANPVKLKAHYVLSYAPNPKVNFQFEVYVNGKLFRKIGLDSGPFGVELSQVLKAGSNSVRVVAKPGDSPATGGESDVASLRILKGEERADGTFVAKPPALWEMVRAAIDRTALERTYTLVAE